MTVTTALIAFGDPVVLVMRGLLYSTLVARRMPSMVDCPVP